MSRGGATLLHMRNMRIISSYITIPSPAVNSNRQIEHCDDESFSSNAMTGRSSSSESFRPDLNETVNIVANAKISSEAHSVQSSEVGSVLGL
jgi:hypothetical protein